MIIKKIEIKCFLASQRDYVDQKNVLTFFNKKNKNKTIDTLGKNPKRSVCCKWIFPQSTSEISLTANRISLMTSGIFHHAQTIANFLKRKENQEQKIFCSFKIGAQWYDGPSKKFLKEKKMFFLIFLRFKSYADIIILMTHFTK